MPLVDTVKLRSKYDKSLDERWSRLCWYVTFQCGLSIHWKLGEQTQILFRCTSTVSGHGLLLLMSRLLLRSSIDSTRLSVSATFGKEYTNSRVIIPDTLGWSIRRYILHHEWRTRGQSNTRWIIINKNSTSDTNKAKLYYTVLLQSLSLRLLLTIGDRHHISRGKAVVKQQLRSTWKTAYEQVLRKTWEREQQSYM